MKHSIALPLLLLSACIAPAGTWTDGAYGPGYGLASPEPAQQYPLFSRDGGVVAAPVTGAVVRGEPAHDVEPNGTGRMYILELYQAAIDERDALELEVESLTSALQRAEAAAATCRQELAAGQGELALVREERDRLAQETDELAGRLLTAQVRRLETEKLLLEAKLGMLGARAEGAAPVGPTERALDKKAAEATPPPAEPAPVKAGP